MNAVAGNYVFDAGLTGFEQDVLLKSRDVPVLVRPQMPREPAPGSDTGYFDLVVDENGDVSQIKLISPRRKYYDRMLVAAAKAWKFRPATLNGQPVKYRLQMPIIFAGMPGK